MKRKALTTIICIAAAALAGCGGAAPTGAVAPAPQAQSGQESAPVVSAEEKAAEEAASDIAKEFASEVEDQLSDTADDAADQIPEANGSAKGYYDGSYYTNDAMGARISLGDDWNVDTFDDGSGDMGQTIMDLQASDSKGTSVVINYEDFSTIPMGEENLQDSYDEIIEGVKQQTEEELVSEFEGVGLEDIDIKWTKTNFLGRECDAFEMSGKIMEYPLSMSQVIYPVGQYMFHITVTGQCEMDSVNAILGSFEKL